MATVERVQRRDGIVYKAKVRRQGHPTTCRTFKTRKAAERWALKFEAALGEDDAGLTSEAQKHTLKEAIDRYRAEILPDLSETSRPNYEQRLLFWEAKLGQLRLFDLTAPRIAAVRDELTVAPATVAAYLAVLASVLTACVRRWHWLKDSPMRQVDKPSVSNARSRFLARDELSRLLEACRASTSRDLYLAVVLAITTGARRGELRGLRWKDVDLERGLLHLRVDNETITKGGVRSLPIAAPALEPLKARLAERQKAAKEGKTVSDLVFPSRVSKSNPIDFRAPFETALRRAGIEGFRWHDLRHSAASFMAAHGASLVEIGAVLGHKSAQTTKRYSHLTEQATHALVRNVSERILNGEGGE
ncbi:MAG: site-specific integrase [Chromatiales bacterium]|nr:site-specific integrase [Chromatiales bacterium]